MWLPELFLYTLGQYMSVFVVKKIHFALHLIFCMLIDWFFICLYAKKWLLKGVWRPVVSFLSCRSSISLLRRIMRCLTELNGFWFCMELFVLCLPRSVVKFESHCIFVWWLIDLLLLLRVIFYAGITFRLLVDSHWLFFSRFVLFLQGLQCVVGQF